ncbi:uncharacterized protein KY384_003621 [Bacidia gigantensis]|uniref:uncharacterized protein n=1 Tax=Bacidia gigantensis TaxID=2732470 RepID=UPI001D0390FF|nr:uncharacterized protein KY384_003621 [Bacidia gigantensis]KAG8531985.1 hypothetical protein KY384_003621 [Bacidia gigantensis]
MASGTQHSEQGRAGNKGLGGGLGNGSNTWTSNIWGNNSFGGSTKVGAQDTNRPQADPFETSSRGTITGSRSLLPSSELDNPISRHAPWKSMDGTSPDFASVQTSHSRASPERRQKSTHHAHPVFAENGGPDPYFPNSLSTTTLSHRSSQKFLDPTSQDFVMSDMVRSNSHAQWSRQDSDDELHFTGNKNSYGMAEPSYAIPDRTPRSSNLSGYNSSVGSRNGSLPPSRGDIEQVTSRRHDAQSLQFTRYGANVNAQRLNALANHPSPLNGGSLGHGLTEQQNISRLEKLTSQFDQMSVANQRRPSYASSQHSPNSTSDHFPSLRATMPSYDMVNSDQLSPTGSTSAFSQQNTYRANLNGQLSHSPGESDPHLSHHSPFYPSTGTPPTFSQQSSLGRNSHSGHSAAQPAILNQRLRNLQQQQSFPNPMRNPSAYPYDVNAQQSFHMNQLNTYYPVQPAPNVLTSSNVPRGPARERDPSQPERSQLLEDFRNNSKTNKRYELKDIYDNIVEFSGDQHGSRFIQQKLETANSDEKDQVFREIIPNAFQLMTDVFGNYVIQKFFEHGNQAQKKTLASKMKGRVYHLSTGMYGCRVVQKALEHVLVDQQATLMKELEHEVMPCVRDQNGNHVIQKAIERVPAEHIQFILNAFSGKVGENATHPYGCRVIQRMLEHCDESTKAVVLKELHLCALTLISDQYGNYVTQHVIEHGRPEDRGRVIDIVINNLVNFSKHKFASNVVETSIQFGSPEERSRIVQKLTATNERGESPVQTLIRDQYGNYVVQKLLTQLQSQAWSDFAEPVKLQVALLKKIMYPGKQITSVEKLLYMRQAPHHQTAGLFPSSLNTSAAPTPPLVSEESQSPQSSSQPSTHPNSVDTRLTSRKSSGESPGAFTPTST